MLAELVETTELLKIFQVKAKSYVTYTVHTLYTHHTTIYTPIRLLAIDLEEVILILIWFINRDVTFKTENQW